MTPAAFLDELAAATRAAETAEAGFRREAAARIAALESERAFAYRRLNWMKSVADVIAAAEGGEEAVAQTRAALRHRLGWSPDDERHAEVVARFGEVARAMQAAPTPAPGEADIRAALADFEAWYQESHGRSFWVLFEHHVPETPLVDF